MEKLRLDKLLANAGCGTRSQVKDLLKKGRVTVNGGVCKAGDIKIDTQRDEVALDGRPVSHTVFEYYMLHKAAGYVSATQDNVHPTVLDEIDSVKKKELFPVGRLDIDTEGLLLITNDGALAHRLLSPAKHVEKTYFARIRGNVTQEDAAAFASGLEIGEDKPTLPARLEILSAAEESEILVTICEGKFHQVKRMFAAVGKEVLYLKRISMGSLSLDAHLPKGAYRPLTEQELTLLKGERHE